ncbi:MAG: ZIP family metal transporter, partial [Flavobacteriia bacterium]
IQLFLSFSGAYLLSITVLHLLPEVYEDSQKNIGLFILLGIVIQTVLEFFSKGAEHGHVHKHDQDITWMLFISLSVHAFLEGMPLGFENHNQLLWAIVIHKVPVAVILFIFLKNTSLSKTGIYIFISFFALMSPLGSFVVGKIPVLSIYHKEVTAVIIGVFLHISTAILFESSDNHHFNLRKFIAIILGFLVAFSGSYLL